MRLFLFFWVVLFLCGAMPSDAHAQSIVHVQDLDFGQAVVRRNDSVYDVLVTSAGNLSAGTNFDYLVQPKEGIYRLTGAAANRPITVMITVDQQFLGGGEQFTIDNFDIDAPATTDVSGEALIRVGARMRTSGSGINYNGSTTFNALMTLSITVL